MRIGIVGGSFNPPHIGHLILAEYVKEALKLKKVIFIPCNIPPHKIRVEIPPGRSRLKMLKLATQGIKGFEVSDLEVKRGGLSYTVDTLKILRKIYPQDELFLIIGSDLYRDFSNWQSPEQIKRLAKLVVVERDSLKRKPKGVIFINMPRIEISSSLIRERIKRGLSVRYMLPEKVRAYIFRSKLYR